MAKWNEILHPRDAFGRFALKLSDVDPGLLKGHSNRDEDYLREPAYRDNENGQKLRTAENFVGWRASLTDSEVEAVGSWQMLERDNSGTAGAYQDRIDRAIEAGHLNRPTRTYKGVTDEQAEAIFSAARNRDGEEYGSMQEMFESMEDEVHMDLLRERGVNVDDDEADLQDILDQQGALGDDLEDEREEMMSAGQVPNGPIIELPGYTNTAIEKRHLDRERVDLDQMDQEIEDTVSSWSDEELGDFLLENPDEVHILDFNYLDEHGLDDMDLEDVAKGGANRADREFDAVNILSSDMRRELASGAGAPPSEGISLQIDLPPGTNAAHLDLVLPGGVADRLGPLPRDVSRSDSSHDFPFGEEFVDHHFGPGDLNAPGELLLPRDAAFRVKGYRIDPDGSKHIMLEHVPRGL